VPPPATPFVASDPEVGHDYVNVSLCSPDQNSPDKFTLEGDHSWPLASKPNVVSNSKSFEKSVLLTNGHIALESLEDDTFLPPSLNYVQVNLSTAFFHYC